VIGSERERKKGKGEGESGVRGYEE